MLKRNIFLIIVEAIIMFLTIENVTAAKLEKATLAGGCFWCMVPPFEKVEGVEKITSGYTGGHTKNPTYEEVSSGKSGHFEAIEIIYDPKKVSYDMLLDIFWQQIDPTDDSGQFIDKGSQYRTAIFYHTPEQKVLAEKSKIKIEESGKFNKPIKTQILKATTFYPAEEYHQNYHKKEPLKYKLYRSNSGRDQFIKKMWGGSSMDWKVFIKPTKDILKRQLTSMQYKVTQENGTEPPFQNAYWNNKKDGIYVDIVSGEPLFSSIDKYDSGTGWPSFTKPLEPSNIVEKEDNSFFTKRIEVRSKRGDSHLGHVFKDGPKPSGLRYCINSSSLRFIPKEDLVSSGYGEYLKLFNK